MEIPTEQYLDWLDHAMQFPQDIADRDYARYQLAVDGLSDEEIDLVFKKVDEKLDLLEASNNTKYCAVVDGNELTLIPGKSSKPLDKFLEKYSLDCAAFITAWNPRSMNLEPEENQRQNLKLQKDIDNLGLRYFKGYGVGMDGEWPAEESYLILGLPRIEAMDLAVKYEQNAFVYCQKGQPNEVVITKLMGT